RDYAQVEGEGVITRAMADAGLTLEGIDTAGLDQLDRRLLKTILTTYQGGPVGIEALAATLNEQQSTLVEVVEPFLLQHGFLARTPTGRKATLLACEHLRLEPGTPASQGNLGL